MKNGQKYELSILDKPYDLTEEQDENRVLMTHKLTGFEVDLYLVTEEDDINDLGFYWGYQISENGLFFTLQDEEIREQANEILFEMLESEAWE